MVGNERLKSRIHRVVFEADTAKGKVFDIILLILIAISIVVVLLESVEEYHNKYGYLFFIIEWVLTFAFTIEYILRIWVVNNKRAYIFSFYGIVDLLSILPTYLSLIVVGSQSLIIIRSLRLLRIFRIFKLGHFLSQGELITKAMKQSREKIFIFLFFVVNMIFIIGALMYLIEGGTNSGFSSIPQSIYWAVVTLTTVGYGDIAPATILGKFVASVVMILGYAVIAVPTGIVTSEMINEAKSHGNKVSSQHCPDCGREGHDSNADYCKWCGSNLHPFKES